MPPRVVEHDDDDNNEKDGNGNGNDNDNDNNSVTDLVSSSSSYGTMMHVVTTTTPTSPTSNTTSPTSKNQYRYYVTIDDAIERIGIGRFQYQVLVAAGLCFMADSMEVLLLSFLSIVLKHDWNLSVGEMNTIISIVFAGALVGTLLLGKAGDYYGRKPIFVITALVISLAGVATAFCQTYVQLLVARFIVGMGVGGLTVPFDTLSEFLPTASRGKNLLYIEFFWTLGTLSVPVVAYLTLDTTAGSSSDNNNNDEAGDGDGESHWQLFVILCSIPCFISTFLGILLVPESPRWLLESSSAHQNNQRDGSESYFSCSTTDESGSMKALAILKAAALTNGISQQIIEEELFPPQTRLITSWKDVSSIQIASCKSVCSYDDSLHKIITSPTHTTTTTNHDTGCLELFTPSRRRITFLLWATWFGLGFLYYGVILAVSVVFTNDDNDDDTENNNNNNDGNGNGNGGSSSSSYDFDYVAIFISASSEIVGLIVALSTIDTFGRIPSQTTSYRMGGVATFLMGIVYYSYYDYSRSNNTNDDNNEDGTDGDTNEDNYYRYVLIGLAFLARMAMMGASCTTWVSTSEILPTEIRSTGHGTANAMARLGGFISPYLITEGHSLVLIGGIVLFISLLTAECAGRLPETAGHALGDSTSSNRNSSSSSNGGGGGHNNSNNNIKDGLMRMDDNDNDNDNHYDDDDNNIQSQDFSDASSTPSVARKKGLYRVERMNEGGTSPSPLIDDDDSTTPIPVPPSAVASSRRRLSSSVTTMSTTTPRTSSSSTPSRAAAIPMTTEEEECTDDYRRIM